MQLPKNNIQKICLSNGLDFSEIPKCLKHLTPLEERVIMPRLSFMTTRYLWHQGQILLKGAVVKINISVNNTATFLLNTQYVPQRL